MATAAPTKASKPAAKKAVKAVTPRVKAAAFDYEGEKAKRDAAIEAVLYQAGDLVTLQEALKAAVEANVRMKMQKADINVFKAFQLKFEPRGFGGSGYAHLEIKLEFDPKGIANAPWMSETDLFGGLPTAKFWSGHFNSTLARNEKPLTGTIEIKHVRDLKKDEPRFVMFDLTVQQLLSATTAWESTRDALMAKEELRLKQTDSSESKAIEGLNELLRQQTALEEQMEELKETIEEARGKVNKIRSDIKAKVSQTVKAAPPVLAHLNALRAQLGLAAA